MGLQFCNEMVLVNQTVFSSEEKPSLDVPDPGEKFGCHLKPFKIDIGTALPPTIRLLPTRSYSGSPIGITYTVSVFTTFDTEAREPDDKKDVIHMIFWVREVFPEVVKYRPMMSISKANLFSDGEVFVQAGLDQNVYKISDPILVNVMLRMHPARRLTKISVTVIQAVDVAMFSSGFFKNEVATEVDMPSTSMESYQRTFQLEPCYSPGKHWVAVMDIARDQKNKLQSKDDRIPRLAPSVLIRERSLFMIKVMYYVQIKVATGSFQRDVNLKVPFLMTADS